MKTFLFGMYAFIKNLPYLRTQNYTHRQIRKILKQYLKLQFLSLFFPSKKETFLFNWKFSGPNMRAISGLFGEMRIKGEYHFNIQKRNPIIFDLGANI
jgi:hypothetical protein